ncbi:MAG TPA: GNAT family N-acetyltransferase [Candidatus Nanopelagicales bacterium]|nr:GNAT family N-acetyltransferase [Candidatus Nanopelagicales bacterium]
MSTHGKPYVTRALSPEDARSGFRCGKHPLDDYFARHAVANDHEGISRTYVLERVEGADPALPRVLGFYTLSMADVEAAEVGLALKRKLPRYPMPVALIGRLAVDRRAQGRRLGEKLLADALRRVVDVAAKIGCLGVIVDAKDEEVERFYARYDFVTVHAMGWPRRMFLPIGVVRAAFTAEPRRWRDDSPPPPAA